jgi:hypothetical protein
VGIVLVLLLAVPAFAAETVGPLGVDFGPTGGFDVLTDADGRDRAWAASGTALYTVDLGTGAARGAGTLPRPVVSLAVLPQ